MLDETAKRTLLSVRVVCGALMAGVFLYGVIVALLVAGGLFAPPAAEAASALLPLSGLLTVASLLSAPFIENMVRRLPDRAARRDVLNRFQTASIVGFAVREAAALFALTASLITGRLIWGLGLAGLVLLGMVLALPGAPRLEEYLKDAGRQRGGS